jgi:hypothetical protein
LLEQTARQIIPQHITNHPDTVVLTTEHRPALRFSVMNGSHFRQFAGVQAVIDPELLKQLAQSDTESFGKIPDLPRRNDDGQKRFFAYSEQVILAIEGKIVEIPVAEHICRTCRQILLNFDFESLGQFLRTSKDNHFVDQIDEPYLLKKAERGALLMKTFKYRVPIKKIATTQKSDQPA